MEPRERLDRLAGVILGTAVGDALGLPREGLTAGRARRLFGGPPLGHAMLAGRGLVSDDTEHTCLVGQALLTSRGEPEAFARALAWELRIWLVTLPPGVGFATLRACLKLWLGSPPSRAGVHSAGNGPCMRAALLGACFAGDPVRLEALVDASTRLTHTDPRALAGARALALAAAHAMSCPPGALEPAAALAALRARIELPEMRTALDLVEELLARGASPAEAATALGCPEAVTGYVMHTVPAVLFTWLRHPGDLRTVVEETVLMGGDADSTAALAGGLAGATLGAAAIPEEWLEGLVEWPRDVAWMRELASRLAAAFPAEGPGSEPPPMSVSTLAQGLRNLLVLPVVLMHGLRRLFPPYGGAR